MSSDQEHASSSTYAASVDTDFSQPVKQEAVANALQIFFYEPPPTSPISPTFPTHPGPAATAMIRSVQKMHSDRQSTICFGITCCARSLSLICDDQALGHLTEAEDIRKCIQTILTPGSRSTQSSGRPAFDTFVRNASEATDALRQILPAALAGERLLGRTRQELLTQPSSGPIRPIMKRAESLLDIMTALCSDGVNLEEILEAFAVAELETDRYLSNRASQRATVKQDFGFDVEQGRAVVGYTFNASSGQGENGPGGNKTVRDKKTATSGGAWYPL